MSMLRHCMRVVANVGQRWYSQVLLDTQHKSPLHIPVMAREVLQNLQPRANGIYVDMTFGAGGHTRQILEAAPGARVIALDRDEDAFALALELKEEFPNQLIPVLGKFSGNYPIKVAKVCKLKLIFIFRASNAVGGKQH